MNSNTISVSSAVLVLPARPNLEHLKKEAKQRLETLRAAAPDSQLSDAQFQLARDYGFTSWRELKAFVDEQSKQPSTNNAIGNAPPDWIGDWIGALGKGSRIALHVSRKDNDALNATVDSRDVGAFDLPAQRFSTDASQLSFGVYIPAAAGNYEATYTGSWEATSQSLTGQWLAHGVSIPFIFKRGTFPPAPTIEGIDGFWDGMLQAQGRYRLTLQVKTDDHGTFAWLDSPDRNSYRVPVTSINRDDRRITFALQTVTVLGELSTDDQTLQGQFVRGETELPLTLTRRPRGAAIPRGVERATVTVPLATLVKYIGVYSFAPERTLTISIVGDDLYAQYPHQPAIQMFASSPTEFFWKQFDASIEFEVVDGNVVSLSVHQKGRTTRAVHIGVSTDPLMAEIMSAIKVLRDGDRPGGRSRLEAIWSRIAANPEPIHECALSHSMADAQDNIADELAWDVRALNAALRCTDADAQRHSKRFSITAFMPSLHASLAEDYFKVGDFARSKDHLSSARAAMSALPDDAYAKLISRSIERIAQRLADTNGG